MSGAWRNSRPGFFIFPVPHRCRSRQIFWGAKDFCPNFPNLPEKYLGHFLCMKTIFWMTSKKVWFWAPFLQIKAHWAPFFSNQSTLGAIFFQIKARWAPFLLLFSGSLPRFSEILRRFSQISTDFSRIFRYFAWIFNKSKLLGVCLHPLHPRLLHHCCTL